MMTSNQYEKYLADQARKERDEMRYNEIEQLRAQLAAAQAECERLRVALQRIEKWFGEFPPVTDRDGKPSEYITQYGTDGERDYMRSVARNALTARPATTGETLTQRLVALANEWEYDCHGDSEYFDRHQVELRCAKELRDALATTGGETSHNPFELAYEKHTADAKRANFSVCGCDWCDAYRAATGGETKGEK